MKNDWHPDELVHHWSLSRDERDLLGNKSGATRLNFAILLKAFQLNARFPERQDDVAGVIVAFVAKEVEVAPEVYFAEDWSERTQRLQRAQVREHCGFRAFHGEDEGGAAPRHRHGCRKAIRSILTGRAKLDLPSVICWDLRCCRV